MNMILRNAYVDGKIKDISICDGIIDKIDDKLSIKSEMEFDCEKNVVIPGFIDAHLHLDKSMLNSKVAYEDVTGPEKGALTRREKEKFTVEDIKERAEKVILKGIASGNLAIRTNVDIDPIVGLKGMEAMLSLKEKYNDILDIQLTAFSQEGFSKYPETKMLLEEALKMGADLVGGHTIVDKDGKAHIDTIFNLAEKYNVEMEFHLDESGYRENYLLPYVAEQMMSRGLVSRVTGIHCCTLSALDLKERESAIKLIQDSKMKITVAPTAISTRQLTLVKELLNAGVKMAIGSDNVKDFFNPLGSGDIKQVALLLAYVKRMFLKEEIESIWNMITKGGAEVIGYDDYGIYEGNKANITVLDAKSPQDVIANQTMVKLMLRNGCIVEI